MYKVGIIGAGNIVKSRHSFAIKKIKNLVVSFVFDINISNANKISKFFLNSFSTNKLNDKLIENIDIILITAPVGVRKIYWEKIFKFKKSVFCEKPLSKNHEEYKWILSMANKSNISLMSGFNRRFYKNTLLLEKLTKNGYFNDLREIILSNSQNWSNTGINGDWYISNPKLAGGGVLIETGSHLLDQVNKILKLKFNSISSIKKVQKEGYTETELSGISFVDFDNKKIPLKFRFGVRGNKYNGIFLVKKNFIIKCNLQPNGSIDILDLKYKKITQFDADNYIDGDDNVNLVSIRQWRQLIENISSNNQEKKLSEFNDGEFATRFIDEVYKKI